MRQRKEFLHHFVHLSGFIQNDACVKIAAVRILRNPVLQSFRVSLNQGDRRLELMGDIGNELALHLLDFLFLFDIAAQFVIGGFKLGNCLLKRAGKLIEILAELCDFCSVVPFVPRAEIQLLHSLRDPCQLQDRPCNSGSQECGNKSAEKNHADSDKNNEVVRDPRVLTDTFDRRPEKVKAAVSEHSPHFHILGTGLAVQNNLHSLIV